MPLAAGWRSGFPPGGSAPHGPVLDVRDAIGSKVAALYSRHAHRDYVDVAAIVLDGRWPPEQVVEMGANNDPGLERAELARFLDPAYPDFPQSDEFRDMGFDANAQARMSDAPTVLRCTILDQLATAQRESRQAPRRDDPNTSREKNWAMARRATGQRFAYVRVSTVKQSPARQLEAAGECDQVFIEKVSGKNIDDRSQLAAIIRHVRLGDHPEADPRKGATIEFLKGHLTFAPGGADPMGMFQLNMMGTFTQFERELIRQRQPEGIEAVIKRSGYEGRPRSLDSVTFKYIRNAALDGISKMQIAREHGISRAMPCRYLETPIEVQR